MNIFLNDNSEMHSRVKPIRGTSSSQLCRRVRKKLVTEGKGSAEGLSLPESDGSKIRISKFLRLINLSVHPINQSVVREASPTLVMSECLESHDLRLYLTFPVLTLPRDEFRLFWNVPAAFVQYGEGAFCGIKNGFHSKK